jgi:hypothetical protein
MEGLRTQADGHRIEKPADRLFPGITTLGN